MVRVLATGCVGCSQVKANGCIASPIQAVDVRRAPRTPRGGDLFAAKHMRSLKWVHVRAHFFQVPYCASASSDYAKTSNNLSCFDVGLSLYVSRLPFRVSKKSFSVPAIFLLLALDLVVVLIT